MEGGDLKVEEGKEEPTLDTFVWLPRLKQIMQTFQHKPAIQPILEKLYEEISYFKPSLTDVAFTRFSHKAAVELAKVIINFGSKHNFPFWIDLFEPYTIYESRYDMAKVFLFCYLANAIYKNDVCNFTLSFVIH